MAKPAQRKKPVPKSKRRPASTKKVSGLEQSFIKFQFSGKAKLSVYRKLVKYLRSGVSLPHALDILWEFASDDGAKPKKALAIVLNSWRQSVREGITLGDAVAGWVPEKDRLVISSGEAAGSLDVALENAIFIHMGGKKIGAAIKSAFAYPIVLILVCIVFMYIVSNQLVPAFDAIRPKEEWTGTGASLATLADFLDKYLIPIGASFMAVVVAVLYSLSRWTGPIRKRLDQYAPYSLYRLSVGSGFLLSMSAMIKAGIPVPKALHLLRKDASPYYKERLTGTLSVLRNGKNFGEALHETGFQFPDKESVNDIRAYASLGGFDETLQSIGFEWMEDSIEKVQGQAAVMKNVGFVMMGAVFMWMAAGIQSLQGQVTAGM